VWRTLISTMKRSGDSKHNCRSPTPTLNGCDLPRRHGHNLLSRNTFIRLPTRGTRQHRTPTTPSKLFMRNPTLYFPKVDKTCVYVFGILPGFLESLVESGNLVCDSVAAMETALGIIKFWFSYSRGILAFTFPGRLNKEMPR